MVIILTVDKSTLLIKGNIQKEIPCAFVSSTHFSVSEKDGKYYLKDFSKNGTYLNGQIVGNKDIREVVNGDEISLSYKGITRLVYRFTVDSSNDPQNIQEPLVSSSSIDIYIHQLELLKQEGHEQESRITLYQNQIEALNKELDTANNRVATKDLSLEVANKEIDDLKERLSMAEANSGIIQVSPLI